jgi:hypothetical protein
MQVETRLRRMEACEAIRHTIYSYAMAGDRGNDAAIMRRLFMPDAVYEAKNMGRFQGLDDIVRGLGKIADDVVAWSFHAPSGPLIDLSEDVASASVFWWVWIPVALRTERGETAPHWGAGHYNARMVSDGGVWKFAEVLFETRLLTPFAGPWTQIDGPFRWPS